LLQASNVYQQAYDLASAFQDQEQMDAAALALGQALLPQPRYREAITVARRTLETGLPPKCHGG
jgi:hypothetical protein